MPRLNNDEQFKFLISCIRWSNNGKVDFTEVAKECKIVTKGAAAKRYERMMKAHGIHQPVSARDPAIPVSRRKEEFISQPAKKRKQDQFDDSHNQAADDDEGLCSVKSEIGCAISEHTTVKNEPALLEDTSAATEYPWLYYNQSDRASLALVDENATFNDFIDSGAYESVDSQAAFVIDPEVERKDNVNEDLGVSDGDIDQQSILILD